jgi:hypothetical protein
MLHPFIQENLADTWLDLIPEVGKNPGQDFPAGPHIVNLLAAFGRLH